MSETASSGLLDLPPMMISIVPIKVARCWYLQSGV